MKKLIFSCLLFVLFLSTAYAQYGTERTGYEGDYFSLEGALDLFKESSTLRNFERKLNTEENWVNNLDLNYDGRIDYIRVEHKRQGNYHAIILQALLGNYDAQDVAVIEIEILGRGEAILQIVGDEDLYGEEVIVEPVEGYTDSRKGYHSDYGDYANVYYWDLVQYIMGKKYRVYVSPYRWQYYPTWWRPWVQCTWSVFRPRIVVYHRYYHVVHRHRVVHVHNFYRTYRSYSYDVVQRTNKVRVKHGKDPINRPAPAVRQDRNQGRSNVAERSNSTTRVNTPRKTSSTRGTIPSSGQKATRSTTPGADQRSRKTRTTRSSTTTRSTTPSRKSSATSRTTPSAKPKASRNTSPRINQSSRNQATRPNTTSRSSTSTRSTTSSRKSSATSRTAPSAKPKANRTTSPRINQSSRNQTTRSSTTTRSTTPSRKPSASSRTAPSVKSKANRTTSPRVNQSSRSQTTRSSSTTRSRTTTRSTTPSRKSSASSRSTPSSKSKTTRSSSPQRSSSSSRSRRGGGG